MESKLKKLNHSAPPFSFISANDFLSGIIEKQKTTTTQTHFHLKASAAPFIPQNPGKILLTGEK